MVTKLENGLTTVDMHLSEVIVMPNTKVNAGDQTAKSGNPGE